MKLRRQHFKNQNGQIKVPNRDQIWEFVSQFVVRKRDPFEELLYSCDEITIYFDNNERIQGLFSVKYLTVQLSDGSCRQVFTAPYYYISSDYRGLSLGQIQSFRYMLHVYLRSFPKRGYGINSMSTYLGYLFLVRHLKDIWPRRNVITPPYIQDLMNQFALQAGLVEYDPKKGVLVRQGVSQYKEGRTWENANLLQDPDIAFYACKNPNQSSGDSLLICLAITPRNFFFPIARIALKKVKRFFSISKYSIPTATKEIPL